jgi:RNA polymerase sigma factor (sigma-70 family)
VLVLRYSDGLSYDEIAEVLKIPLGTVKSRLNTAIKALREELVEGGDA